MRYKSSMILAEMKRTWKISEEGGKEFNKVTSLGHGMRIGFGIKRFGNKSQFCPLLVPYGGK